jgi:hypothetical protein
MGLNLKVADLRRLIILLGAAIVGAGCVVQPAETTVNYDTALITGELVFSAPISAADTLAAKSMRQAERKSRRKKVNSLFASFYTNDS